ncbi:MAG: 3-deoxy-D-manno-octulosonic acid transferase [Verrucomicrobiota bacterium]
MRLLYTILYALGFVLLSPVFLYKMWKRGKYRENFSQRFGRYSPELRAKLATKTGPRCWLQAVSVGEVNIALVFLATLRKAMPAVQVVLTTTTSTGYALARERLPADVVLLYFPQDFPACVRRAYALIQPDFILLMESEVWPNHVWEAARRSVPLFLINARMSPRSVRRQEKVRWLFGKIFDKFTLVCAQSQEDAGNFRRFGSPRVEMTGNLKYDAALPSADAPRDVPVLGVTGAVLVAGSTHPGEEEILFDLLKQMPELFLVLVPRHVERAPEIIELAKRKGIAMELRKNGGPVPNPTCLLVNTTGELKWFYGVATVIFVGKSLVGIGGQNIVEAAASGHPVICGPNMQNFKAITAEFLAAGACVQVQDASELLAAVRELCKDESRRANVVAAAKTVIERNVGATQRTVDLIAASLRL